MDWHIVVAAVATSTAIHSAMEPSNVLDKLDRLSNAIKTGKVRETKIKNIDTRAKSYALGVSFITFFALISYLIINAIDPSIDAALTYTVAVLLLGEFALTYGLDKYHVMIEKITKTQAKKKK